MELSDFDFQLPSELIAQEPLPHRDESRLLRIDKRTQLLSHCVFSQLPSLLRPGDLLVVNDSQVFQARLVGKKIPTEGKAELLLVRPFEQSTHLALTETSGTSEWVCLGQASKGLKRGSVIQFSEGLSAEITEVLGGGEIKACLRWPPIQSLGEVLHRAGRIPLPPYIHREPTAADFERYQTVYAQKPGSVAAPTAGLHFTPEILSNLQQRGIERVAITLEVGPGTFLPVRDGNVASHKMHEENFLVSPQAAGAIRRAKQDGRRVIAVGTTVVRTLESAASGDAHLLKEGAAKSELFIRPGFEFKIVDALITNFHLPKSTLLMLVSAFLGREQTLKAYEVAIKNRYRFFSYGDAMLIEDGHAER